MTFGERLFELRKQKNISQEELAELLNVSRQSISKWENDKAYPEMTRLLFMSDYFEVSLDYLMRGVEEHEPMPETTSSYKAENLLTIWNTFISNLTGPQKNLMLILYALITLACIGIITSCIYGAGYAVGKFIGHMFF